jgi:hypothetical protein
MDDALALQAFRAMKVGLRIGLKRCKVSGALRRRFKQAELLMSARQFAELGRGPACALFVEYLSAVAFALADERGANGPSVLAGGASAWHVRQ